jgi:hypothetical protein
MKRPRLNIYLEGNDIKRRIKIAAAKRDISITEYCTRAIAEQLIRDGDAAGYEAVGREDVRDKEQILREMDELRQSIGPIGVSVTELIHEGRRR